MDWLLSLWFSLLSETNNKLFRFPKVPYQSCQLSVSLEILYNTTVSISDSMFTDVEHVRRLLWNFSSVQSQCNHSKLLVTPERIINRLQENKQIMVYYNITVGVKKRYRYNFSILKDLRKNVEDCYYAMDKDLQDLIDSTALTNVLTLNISGSPLNFSGPLRHDRSTCEFQEPRCPARSVEENRTCGRFIFLIKDNVLPNWHKNWCCPSI